MAASFPSVLIEVEAQLAGESRAVAGAVFALFSSALLRLAEDELAILGQATEKLLEDLRAGKSVEESVTAGLNAFYSGEVNEAGKIAMAILEAIARVVGVLAR